MRGLVAFCDVLGYSSFLENNDPQRCIDIANLARHSASILKTTLSASTKQSLLQSGKSEKQCYFDRAIRELDWIDVSDSTLFFMPYEIVTPQNARNWASDQTGRIACFFIYLTQFAHSMLSHGFPIRGGVVEGEFIALKGTNQFAGRSIVIAHKIEERLKLAGVRVVLPELPANDGCVYNEIDAAHRKSPLHFFSNQELGHQLLLSYNIPTDYQGKTEHGHLLDPSGLQKPEDPRQYLVEKFSQYKKTMNTRSWSILDATERFYRFAWSNGSGISPKQHVERLQNSYSESDTAADCVTRESAPPA